VGALDLVELERAGDSLQHVFGDAAHAAALQLDVILDADAGEESYLFTAKPGHAAPAAVGGKAGLLGRDPRPPRGQELADLVAGAHGVHVRSLPHL